MTTVQRDALQIHNGGKLLNVLASALNTFRKSEQKKKIDIILIDMLSCQTETRKNDQK
jgi:hypothetical protein